MFSSPLPKRLRPSGLPPLIYAPNEPFDSYQKRAETLILSGRTDFETFDKATVLAANLPFDFPCISPHPSRVGVLLIHGLYSAPLSMLDIGRACHSAGMHVRSLLLPGHGTRPADLAHIRLADWRKSVTQAIEQFKQEVDSVFLCGYSMGSALSLIAAADLPNTVKGIISLAPAIKIAIPILPLSNWYLLFKWASPSVAWHQINPDTDYARYESLHYNSAHQSWRTVCQVKKSLPRLHTTPVFTILTAEDELICVKSALNFIRTHGHPKDESLIYAQNPSEINCDGDIKSSVYPDQHIRNFSHICLTHAPDNPHYGIGGDYANAMRSKHTHTDASCMEFGAFGLLAREEPNYCRLSYNPDFPYLAKRVVTFIENNAG